MRLNIYSKNNIGLLLLRICDNVALHITISTETAWAEMQKRLESSEF